MSNDIRSIIKQICDEKGLSYEAVIVTIESALAAAYRKDFGQKNQNIKVELNEDDIYKSKVYDIKTVVEDMPEEEEAEGGEENDGEDGEKEKGGRKKAVSRKAGETADAGKAEDASQPVPPDAEIPDKPAGAGGEEEETKRFNPKTEIQISEAKLIKKTAKIGDEIKTRLEVPDEYGRMAAQTAKQVIIQRLREAEREMVFNEFKDKEKEVVSGVVQRREGRMVLVDLGKSVGVLPPEDQIPGEMYRPGGRVKVFVREVSLKSKGPEIILSRTSDEILKKVFYLEIPEIANGLIELKNVAREAGSRSKVAVWTDSENVDPIGSCVGQKGARIQTIIGELGGEKVDIIEYDEDPIKFISNALSPARVTSVSLNKESNKATVRVSADQLSLAIGKGGQNARLAARLTGWKIDIAENKPEKDEKAGVKDGDKKDGEGKDKGGEKEPADGETGGAEQAHDEEGEKKKKDDAKAKEKKTKTKKKKAAKDAESGKGEDGKTEGPEATEEKAEEKKEKAPAGDEAKNEKGE